MLEKLDTFKNNVVAIEVIDGFTEVDAKICEKFMQEKMDEGFGQVNVLVKLDELKISHSNAKAFMEDIVWSLRNMKHMGHLAIVAHSKMVKALVPIDNLFFERSAKGREERYFDVSPMDQALEFVKSGK